MFGYRRVTAARCVRAADSCQYQGFVYPRPSCFFCPHLSSAHSDYHAQQTRGRLGQSDADVSELCEPNLEPEQTEGQTLEASHGFPRRGIGINLVAGMTSILVWGGVVT